MLRRTRKSIPYLHLSPDIQHTSATFDLQSYLAKQVPDSRILDTSEGRKAVTRYDPLLFALVYCPGAVKAPETEFSISFSDLHLELCRSALYWASPSTRPKESRTAYIAPRESGKSTWAYKLLPLWAAAHQHRMFIAAFADSATQASDHLDNFRLELESNKLLREDFPELCAPARRKDSGNVQGDSKTDFRAQSGFVFKARGIDSSILGMKVGDRRPDLIICDDLEKGESNYSVEQAKKRLQTLMDTILPLSQTAIVMLTGTVNMVGSIMDDLARAYAGDTADWITAISFKVKYFPALVKNDDGTDRSMWPAKWPIPWLEEEQRIDPRGFAKNFMNQPLAADGGYWEPDYFRYGSVEPTSFTVLSVDPAVSAKSTSDWTGLAVISYSRSLDKFCVRHAEQVRLTGSKLRDKIVTLLDRFPEVTSLLVETNQGGELWTDADGVFKGLAVKIITVHQKDSKEVRAERAVIDWTREKVMFEKKFPELERQLLAFPKVQHDDMVDALTTGINEIRTRVKNDQRRGKSRGLVAGRVHYQ